MKKLKKKIDDLDDEERFIASVALIQYGGIIFFMFVLYLLSRLADGT